MYRTQAVASLHSSGATVAVVKVYTDIEGDGNSRVIACDRSETLAELRESCMERFIFTEPPVSYQFFPIEIVNEGNNIILLSIYTFFVNSLLYC